VKEAEKVRELKKKDSNFFAEIITEAIVVKLSLFYLN